MRSDVPVRRIIHLIAATLRSAVGPLAPEYFLILAAYPGCQYSKAIGLACAAQ